MKCLFCKIVAGEIASTKVYKEDRVMAFMDINPVNKGHLLVVPKNHTATIYEIGPDDLMSVITVAQKLAKAQSAVLGMPGLNLVQCNGWPANQVVDHFHVHLVPRWPEDGWSHWHGSLISGDMEEIKATAEKIKARLV